MKRLYATGCLVAILAAALLAASCGNRACTLIGCGNGLTIDFRQVDSSTWQDGDWRLEMTTPSGEYATCDFQIPAGDAALSGQACDGPLSLEFSSDGTRLVEATSWRSSPDEVPRNFDITLIRDSSEVASQSFEPDYTESRPNGEDCPPVCAQASVGFSE